MKTGLYRNALCMTSALVCVAMAAPGYAQIKTADTTSPAADSNGAQGEILVTGSRISRAGFDQPTPTTVIGAVELRQGARENLAQVLNDLPAFRPTVTQQSTNSLATAGSAQVDLRGLGTSRTLTLLNGRRMIGQNNLNYLPLNVVERVEVVTGGASAAYGSDAIAGVVNIIINDKLKGFTLGGVSGVSSRGDGPRYGADASFGTSFADDRGHFLAAAEYLNEKYISDRNSRKNLGSAAIVRLDPTSTTDTRQILVRDVNFGNQASGGLITSGVLAGQVFNDDGTLRPFRGGTSLAANPTATPFPAQMIGGADGVNTFDAVGVSVPLERISAFGRATYDLGDVTVWAEGSYGRSKADYAFYPDIFVPSTITIQATNPFLSSAIRSRLAAAGQTSFTLGKFFNGPFQLSTSLIRDQKEGAIGIDGIVGRFKFNAHYSHGQINSHLRVVSPVLARYNNATNAVSSSGQIVCAINADTITTNDDPACRPLNLFGQNAASADALNYINGTQRNDSINKLDSIAGQIQGDLVSLWAGPITAVVGAEARFEQQKSVSGALDLGGAFGPLGFYGSPIQGGFNVKEGFGELALPLLDVQDKIKVDLNGAARYSDYSRSGGIWSWKAGGTARLVDTVTLRATRSRDIRAPSITELFNVQSIGVGTVIDQDTAGRLAANAAYNASPSNVVTLGGGNPNLAPEIGKTVTFGATFSPKFIRAFNLSVDYYDVKVSNAIASLSASNLTLACRNGSAAACSSITRDATGTITQVRSTVQNIASFETKGIDFEASYLLEMSALHSTFPGSLSVRALATYVKNFIFNSGAAVVDTAGDVGSSTANAVPKWRGNLSFTYQSDRVGLDARIRYVGGGLFNHLLENVPNALVNNHITSRTYLDLGVQLKVKNGLTIFGDVNNVFDRQPPISPGNVIFYDVVGRYFTAGARLKF